MNSIGTNSVPWAGAAARHSVAVAIGALDEVDVVGAFGVGGGGIHLFHVEAAVGEAGVALGAGGAGLLAVLLVTGEATESFMHADGCAVVAGCHLGRGLRGVTLVAQGLARIGAGRDGARSIAHGGEWQKIEGEVLLLAAIEEGQPRPRPFPSGRVLAQALAVAVQLMAGETRDGRLVGEFGAEEAPGSVGIEGRNQVADPAFEVDAVAAEAIRSEERRV